jgi:DNA-binding transcriptional LysR family regulator
MSAVISASSPAIDLTAVKTRQQAAWAAGNYAVVGTTLQIVGENLCEALDLRAGSRVLDVAAGNGNATLAAARRWCDVTSIDYVSSLLELGRARAQAEVTFMSTAIGFVRAGLGVTILPTASLEVQSAKDLGCRRFSERALTRRIGILKRRDRSLGPSVETFAAFLVQSFKGQTGGPTSR